MSEPVPSAIEPAAAGIGVQERLELGADVTVLDTNIQRLRELDALYAGRVKTIASNGSSSQCCGSMRVSPWARSNFS